MCRSFPRPPCATSLLPLSSSSLAFSFAGPHLHAACLAVRCIVSGLSWNPRVRGRRRSPRLDQRLAVFANMAKLQLDLTPRGLEGPAAATYKAGNFTPATARPCYYPPHWHEHLQPGEISDGRAVVDGGGRGRRAAAGDIFENASVLCNSGNLYLLDGMAAGGGARIIPCQVHER